MEADTKLPTINQKRMKIFQTTFLVLAWICMGISGSIVSTTIPEFRTRYNTTTDVISFAISIGDIGGILAAPLYLTADRAGSYSSLLVSFCLAWCGLFGIVRVISPTVIGYGLCEICSTIGWLTLDAVGNSFILAIWQEESNGPMHALHFGFPVGAFLGPLLATPFLAKNITTNDQNQLNDPDSDGLFSPAPDNSRLEILFCIVALICIVSSAVFLCLQIFCSPKVAGGIGKSSYKWKEAISPAKWANGDSKYGLITVTLLISFYVVFKGATRGVGTFIVPYLVDSDLGFTNQQAAIVSSAINFFGAIARGLGIIIPRYITIKILLTIDVHGFWAACLLLTIFATINSRLGVYIFCCMYGLFRDPIYPACFAFVDKYILILSTVVGLLNIIQSFFDFLFTALQGYLYEHWTMESIFYTGIVYSSIMCVILYTMLFYLRHKLLRHNEDEVEPIEKSVKIEGQDNVIYTPRDNDKQSSFYIERDENTYL